MEIERAIGCPRDAHAAGCSSPNQPYHAFGSEQHWLGSAVETILALSAALISRRTANRRLRFERRHTMHHS